MVSRRMPTLPSLPTGVAPEFDHAGAAASSVNAALDSHGTKALARVRAPRLSLQPLKSSYVLQGSLGSS